jgi:hypothetical protein
MVFENAAIALEHAEHAAATARPIDAVKLAAARTAFAGLQATPWLARADRVALSRGQRTLPG